MSSEFPLSAEQKEILGLAESPNSRVHGWQGKLVRITAAAGTGKTTTLLALAKKAISVGHSYITYVTFNKSAAVDGQARLQQELQQQQQCLERWIVDARTLHSCAFKVLSDARKEDPDNDDDPEAANPRFLNEQKMESMILEVLGDEIEEFLRPCYRTIETRVSSGNGNASASTWKIESFKNNALKQVVFFLHKTLVLFCRSSHKLDVLRSRSSGWKRRYFPAEKFHVTTEKGNKAGFVKSYYNKNKLEWYPDQVCILWDYLEKHNYRSFDLEMKRAQLRNLRIRGTFLLVDECQDMDGCQVAWVAQQAKFGTHVFFVGDAAQSIYGFRGAKSRNMMELGPHVVDRSLTTSWRFGKNIAQIANVVLFAKEKSPQTTENKKPSWSPYRVTGGSKVECHATFGSLLQHCYSRRQQVTLIARTNAALLVEAVQLLGLTNPEDDDGDGSTSHDDANTVPIVSQEWSEPDDATSQAFPAPSTQDPFELPKIHLNGKGESSGVKRWKTAIVLIEHLLELYRTQPEPMHLPEKQFPEFSRRLVEWSSFQNEVVDRELGRYVAPLAVIQKFKDRTAQAIQLFQEEVIDKGYREEQANFILSTCHTAKGLEWDYVQLCNDFTDQIQKVNDKGPLKPVATVQGSYGNPVKKKPRRTFQFDTPSYGDDLNLLYVACTRAKRLLSVPHSMKSLFQDCDVLHEFMRATSQKEGENLASGGSRSEEPTTDSNICVLGLPRLLSEEEAAFLYQDICGPLREQAGLRCDSSCRLLETLVTDLDAQGD